MKKIDELLDKILSVITVILYIIMIIVVLMQIAARYIPSLTLSWTEEFTRFLFVFIVTLGAPLSLKYYAFADVDLLYDKLGNKAKKVLYVIIYLSVLIFDIVVILSGYNFVKLGSRSVSPALHWPMYLHHSTIILFGIFSTFYCIVKLIKFFKNPQKAIDDYRSREVIE